MGENRQRQMSLPVFVTHCMGLPPRRSPLVFLHPQLLRRVAMSHPHPLERGRTEGSAATNSTLVEVSMVEPTSLNRGEGLVAGCMWLGANGGGEGDG
jgi:hypothetical protein